MKSNKMLFVLCLLIAASVLAACNSHESPGINNSIDKEITQEEIVTNMQNQGNRIANFYGNINIQTTNGTVRDMQNLQMWFNVDGPFRITTETEENGPSTSVYDGNSFWVYSKNENSVVKMPLPMAEFLTGANFTLQMMDYLANSEELFLFNYSGTDEIAGHSVYILEVTPKDSTAGILMTWWIDAEDWFPVKYSINAEGTNITVTHNEYEINPVLSADIFTFEVPEGAEILDMENLFDDFENLFEDAVDDLKPEDLGDNPESEVMLQNSDM